MTRPTSIFPPGLHFTRMAIALHFAKGDPMQAAVVAQSRWGEKSTAALALKAAVSAGGTDNLSALAEASVAASEFISAVRPLTITGRLSGVRRVPLHIKVPRETASATVGWVGERSPTPITGLQLDTVTLDPLKLAGIVVTTRELANHSSPAAEELLRQDLVAGVAAASDAAFIDPSNAGETDVKPASVTYNADSVTPTGTTAAALRADVAMLVDKIQGDFEAPHFVTDRRLAMRMAMMPDPIFRAVTANGGLLAGIPLLISASSPNTSANDSPAGYSSALTLLDAADVLLGDEGGAEIMASQQATVQMDSAPDSPITGNTVTVSLYQHNLTAFRCVREINWRMRRQGRVAYISGAHYAE